MIVKAKYCKEIEVTDDISQEEIERICKYGMPDRFDCMADSIDNEQPLEFHSWEFVDDKYYRPTPNINTSKKEELIEEVKDKDNVLYKIILKWIVPVIFAVIFGVICGLMKHSLLFGLLNTGLFFLIWIPVTIIISWVHKVNQFMKGEK